MNTEHENSDNKNLKQPQSEIDNLINKIKKDDNFGEAIEKIFANEKDPNIIKEKIILLLKTYLKSKHKDKSKKETEELEAQIEKNINRVSKKFIDIVARTEVGINENQDKDLSEIKAINDYKRIIKGFVIYEIYKVMNPKRIAGETKKDNYKHNLAKGGQKLASKYEGGKPEDLKKYGKAEVGKINAEVAASKKQEGWQR